MAIILTFVSLTILLLLFLGPTSKLGMWPSSYFPHAYYEYDGRKFVTIQSDRGFKGAIKVVLEVLFGFYSMLFRCRLGTLKDIGARHPEIILFFLIFNFL